MAVLDCVWDSPPADLAMSRDEVHIWCASLNQPATHVQRLAQTLSADEQLRADRFHFEGDRLRFIVGRGLLRVILGRYLNVEPSRLRFCYSAYGKPSLDLRGFQYPLDPTFRFNLAHSHELVLYAITRERKIGVDLEYVRPIVGADQIAEQFFSSQERAVLRALSTSQKQEAFFNCWTRKEAYLKASGCGLDWPLDSVEVSLAPGEPARLLSIAGDRQQASRWFIQALTPAHGYMAAVAVKGHGWQLKYWDLAKARCGLERRRTCSKRFQEIPHVLAF